MDDDEVRVRGRRLPRPLLVTVPSVLPALLMLVVGAVGLRNPAIGWDENATWLAAGRSVGQIVALARHLDGVIAPYYLFMHFWTGVFGDSEVAMRAPSLLAVAAGVGISAELGRRLFGPVTGLLAGLLLVTVPQLSRYAQDARVYGFAFLMATLATLLLHRAVREPSWSRWTAYGVAVALLGLAHILALLVLIGHAYAVLTRARAGGGWRRWAVVTGAGLLPVLPLAYLGLTQRGTQLDWLPFLTVGEALRAPGDTFGSAAVGLLLIGLALMARPRDGRALRELAVLAVAPPAVLIVFSFVVYPLWVPRYVLVVVPAVCLAAAVSLRAVPVRALLALLLVAAVGLPAHSKLRSQTSHAGPDFRTIAGHLRAQQQPGDVIVYGTAGTWALRAGVDYQLRGQQQPRDVLLRTPAADIGELEAVQCADPVACLGSAPRVWLFRWQPPGKLLSAAAPLKDAGALATVLPRDYRVVGDWQATKADLILFARR